MLWLNFIFIVIQNILLKNEMTAIVGEY